MDQDFDTFLIGLYLIVDDWLKELGHCYIRPEGGAPPALSDAEMLTLILAQQFVFAPWSERRWLAHNGYRAWFPALQDQSAYNRRARNLSGVLAALRVTFAQDLLADLPPEAVVDGTPIHVRHWRRYGRHYLALPEADLGYCAAKREYFYGYRLVALVTLGGVVIDYSLLPASGDERDGLEELLTDEEQWQVWGDKGLLDERRQARLADEYNIRLVAPQRRNQKHQLPPEVQGELHRKRPIVETTFAQAKGIFALEQPGAHTWSGLLVRVVAKLTAMTLMAWANVRHGRSPLTYVQFAW